MYDDKMKRAVYDAQLGWCAVCDRLIANPIRYEIEDLTLVEIRKGFGSMNCGNLMLVCKEHIR